MTRAPAVGSATPRKDAGGRNLDDAVVSWPDAGGFQVHAHQRSRQDEMGGKLLREMFYIHGFI